MPTLANVAIVFMLKRIGQEEMEPHS